MVHACLIEGKEKRCILRMSRTIERRLKRIYICTHNCKEMKWQFCPTNINCCHGQCCSYN